jgi:protocatechuate 3,4-dioxygenase beta subunit
MGPETSRRSFLQTGALGLAGVVGTGWLTGCAGGVAPAEAKLPGEAPGQAPASTSLLDGKEDGVAPTPMCGEDTMENIEGPYYRAGAPDRTTLVEPDMAGRRLELSGLVMAHGSPCQPLAGATIDIWQADSQGAYDADGYTLRGVFTTDANGAYRIPTILPGRYLNGSLYRPRHLHVKVRADGRPTLTTQLYFQGDPYNDFDDFILPSLIMPVERVGAALHTRFDFVI